MQHRNYHTHSHYCDGQGQLQEYVEKAIGKGFEALGFSGHAPLPFVNDWTMDDENLPLYLNEVTQLKRRYRDEIEIYVGLEIDYLDETHNPANPIFDRLKLDYRIGSVHMLQDPEDEKYYSIDGPVKELEHLIQETYAGSVEAFLGAYYRQIQNMIRSGGFQILGHFDLPKKHNGSLKYFSESETWYHRMVEETLETVAKGSVILEVNTGAMSRGYTQEPYPAPWILELCRDLDIPIMLNSDAHKPDWIDYAFDEAEKLILNAGIEKGWALRSGEWQEVKYGEGEEGAKGK